MQDIDCQHFTAQNIVSSIQGRFIYKDECAKCFVNQKSEEGVSLCLTCLIGGCDRHAQLHSKTSGHPIVLNFKARVKPKTMEEEEAAKPKPKEITRLAIGKPGGADFTDEDWELITEVRCIPCSRRLDPTKFQGVIESIIKAESASVKSALSAWEQEIKPCAHTMTMEQTTDQKLAAKSLAHCNSCELSTNLWLCLFCGNLGCGRKNYDGTGGNGHAGEHHKQTGHTVVVKLGTITPDGSASVYCYGCDDDVEDEKLTDHLSNFGINIAKLEKTEKTMAELNLQMNLNLTLSSVIEKGRKITPVFGEGFTGMQNLGNSCYMNSVLQTLFAVDEFKERYYKDGLKHLETCTSYTPECLICQMSKIGYGIFSGDYSQRKESEPMKVEGQEPIELEPYQDGIRPYMFKMLVGKGHEEFSTDRQQDANEYLSHLFNLLQKAEKKAQLSDITNIFNFKSTTHLACQICHGYKINETVSQEILLPIPKSNNYREEEDPTDSTKEPEKIPLANFEDCVNNFQTEFVSLNCPKCKNNNTFKKTIYFKTWPKYLLATMNRTLLDDWVPKKDVSEIVFNSEVLDLSRFKLPTLDPSARLQEEEAQEEGPQFNQESIDQLTMMGFGINRAKRALLENGHNVEQAMNWLCEKIDDPSLDDPLPTSSKKKAAGPVISEELIGVITSMGFSEKQARFALIETNNDPDRAVDYLFNHPAIDELILASEKAQNAGASEEKEMEVEDTGVYKYQIKGVVVHLGKNYSSGHYVCYVKKDGKWIYFNDAKVAESTDPAIGKGVLYLLERVSV